MMEKKGREGREGRGGSEERWGFDGVRQWRDIVGKRASGDRGGSGWVVCTTLFTFSLLNIPP